MWAPLIQMGKHESYKVPPNQPFFKDAKSRKKDKLPNGQLLKTLLEWHGLFKDGAITKEEYEPQKE